MTNKIYLSFNRLYTLKDGDYHGAKLSYRIKHGDQVIAEGEQQGKSLSRFISPVSIKELEITNPLSVEYVCTGNVEDVSVSVGPMHKKNTGEMTVKLTIDAFAIFQGQTFIKSAMIYPAIITNAGIKLAEDAHLIGGKVPKIGDHLPDATQREKVMDIVGRYLSGAGLEYADEMADELMAVITPVLPDDVHTGGTLDDCKKSFADSKSMPFGGFPRAKVSHSAGMKISVQEVDSDHHEMKSPSELNEKIVAVLKEQLRPGGILWGR